MILGMVWAYSAPFFFRHKFYAPTAGVSSLTDGFSLGGRRRQKNYSSYSSLDMHIAFLVTFIVGEVASLRGHLSVKG